MRHGAMPPTKSPHGHEPKLQDDRVIVHIDLDAFYAQVESVRRGIAADVPLAVLQWQAVIAVNYEARKYGITRMMKLEDLEKACPQLLLVHVDTVSVDDDDENALELEKNSLLPPLLPKEALAAVRGNFLGMNCKDQETARQLPNPESRKVTLEVYRRASLEIMDIFRSAGCQLEKAGIDEAFLDVTQLVHERLKSSQLRVEDLEAILEKTCLSVPIEDGGPVPDLANDVDRRLVMGAQIALELRTMVFEQLHYTCSAGISVNKTLAKLGSAMNKPNNQTLLLPAAISVVMHQVPIRKIRNLGGKLGKKFVAAGMEHPAQLLHMSIQEIAELITSKEQESLDIPSAQFVYEIIRGIDNNPIVSREKAKSMLASKNFGRESDWDGIRKWLKVLASEIHERMTTDEQRNKRRAKTLTVGFRTNRETHSRRADLPERCTPEIIWNLAFRCLQDSNIPVLPCTSLGLSASNFVDTGKNNAVNVKLMERFVQNSRKREAEKEAGISRNHTANAKQETVDYGLDDDGLVLVSDGDEDDDEHVEIDGDGAEGAADIADIADVADVAEIRNAVVQKKRTEHIVENLSSIQDKSNPEERTIKNDDSDRIQVARDVATKPDIVDDKDYLLAMRLQKEEERMASINRNQERLLGKFGKSRPKTSSSPTAESALPSSKKAKVTSTKKSDTTNEQKSLDSFFRKQ